MPRKKKVLDAAVVNDTPLNPIDEALLTPVQADYLHPKLKVPYRLYRYDKYIGGEEARFYLEFIRDASGTVKDSKKYKSVTSWSHDTIPKGAGYHKWLQMRGALAETERAEKAVFGTMFHVDALRPLLGQRHPIHGLGYNFDWLGQIATVTAPDGSEIPNPMGWNNFEMMFHLEHRHKASAWMHLFKTGLASWFQFIRDKVENVLAVEIPLRSTKFPIAGVGDLFHEAKFHGKSRICYTDIKSFLYQSLEGTQTKTYYEGHEFQAAAMLHLWNENFPEFPCTHSFMWSPKKFRNEPTYEWKNMSSSEYFETRKGKTIYEMHMEYYASRSKAEPKASVLDIVGSFDSLESFQWEKHIRTYEF